jgi:hypothetical protein
MAGFKEKWPSVWVSSQMRVCTCMRCDQGLCSSDCLKQLSCTHTMFSNSCAGVYTRNFNGPKNNHERSYSGPFLAL